MFGCPCGFIRTGKNCKVALSECAEENMLYRGLVCQSCIMDYPYIVDKLIGSNFMKNKLKERMFYPCRHTFYCPKQRKKDEEQEIERSAKEEEREQWNRERSFVHFLIRGRYF